MGRFFARGKARSPFVEGEPRPVLVHCSYHKSGTEWIRKILQGVAEEYGLTIQARRHDQPLRPDVDIILNQGSRHAVEGLANVRGSHMIRDPRDVAVSAYHYHLWTEEPWVHVPSETYGGKTYQEHLNALDADEGLSEEIRRLAGTVFQRMADWDYLQPNYFELRYEDVIADETLWFERLFRHYTFNEDAIARALTIADGVSFKKASGRKLGDVQKGSKMRSGRPGQWREELTAEHVALFKRLTGDLVVRLGYETDENW